MGTSVPSADVTVPDDSGTQLDVSLPLAFVPPGTYDVGVANPDGHAHNWRFNFDPTADPEFGERGKGYDINRYHNPTMAPANNPVFRPKYRDAK